MLVTTEVVDLVEDYRMGVITIDNPPLNVLSRAVLQDIDVAFGTFRDDSSIDAMVLTAKRQEGRGIPYFSSGADLRMLCEFAQGPREEAERFFNELMAFGMRLERSPKPLIGYVNGTCLGGALELMLCCDQIFADPTFAGFGSPEIKFGFPPGFGGTQRVIRRMGFGMGLSFILRGDTIDAVSARDMGLIDGIGPVEGLPRVMAEVCMVPHMVMRPEHQGMRIGALIPQEVAELGRGRYRLAVDLTYQAALGNRHPLPKGLTIERDCFMECFTSEEVQKALAAFGRGERYAFSPDSLY